ncbi:MAG: transcription termination factor NusA [Oscillospiraceae bacterium]|jgi:N utilization substance protein A|nr:transcription termination factor NusA [Oscillospiraceae bacterium]
MNNNELFEAMMLVAEEKGIDTDTLIEKIQTALTIAIKKDYRSDNVKFDIDIKKGKFDVCIGKLIVEEVEDSANQISLEDAKKISKTKKYKIGDECIVKLNTRHFGRIAAQNAKQVVKQGIKEVERNQLIEQWGSLQNGAVSVRVVSADAETGDVTVEINGSEVTLFRRDQIPGEEIYVGDNIKVYVSGVSANDRQPTLRISRTHNNFIKRLLESEVPEIYDGVVEIKAVSREAGQRSKVAVFSNDENVDAVGSCIGPSRSRISKVCEEINGEKIDVIVYSDDPKEFVRQALKPADVIDVDIHEGELRACTVIVPDNQLSLAIGNKGQNAKLAARLTGFKIDIRPESGFYEG